MLQQLLETDGSEAKANNATQTPSEQANMGKCGEILERIAF